MRVQCILLDYYSLMSLNIIDASFITPANYSNLIINFFHWQSYILDMDPLVIYYYTHTHTHNGKGLPIKSKGLKSQEILPFPT